MWRGLGGGGDERGWNLSVSEMEMEYMILNDITML